MACSLYVVITFFHEQDLKGKGKEDKVKGKVPVV
jgi:hypothetical protein